MKHILLLSFTFCLLSSMQAQNPYLELGKPWLNLKIVKEKKVKTIMLATMSADNSTLEKQVKLSLNGLGQLVTEEGQIGIQYSEKIEYDAAGFISKCIYSEESWADTIDYVFIEAEHKFISQSKRLTQIGSWQVYEAIYWYDNLGNIKSIVEYEGIIAKVDAPGHNSLSLINEITFSRVGNSVTIKTPATFQTFTYNDNGVLQTWQSDNLDYGLSEKYEYNYDQTGRLVLINWSQDGQTSKTFVTYEYYQ